MKDKIITRVVPVPRITTIANKPIRKKQVAAYARVSSTQSEQETSFKAQVDYYIKYIEKHPEWEYVKVYSDKGISGCRANIREGFMEMISDCEKGLIDLIITKSISRFARNTLDSIKTIRKLKSIGVGVYFEKENIFTLDSNGEFIITLMSSLAQEESRSISENVIWGHRKRFADGKVSIPYSRVLGFERGTEKNQIIINAEQAVIVRRIFRMCLQGYTPHTTAKILTNDGIPSPGGKGVWNSGTIRRMLSNEKYKGDALLQKEFTVDFLTKKHKKNEGELPQYYVEGNHEAIISPWLFDYIQEKYIKRDDSQISSHSGRYSGVGLYCSKIICAKCGGKFGIRPWHSTTYNNPVWQCGNRYKSDINCRTVNIYDKYLHFITHTLAMQKTRKMTSAKKILVECIFEVVGPERAEEIQNKINKYLHNDVWNLWADEDDLSLVMRRILVGETGKITVQWIDESKSEFRMERFSPKKHY